MLGVRTGLTERPVNLYAANPELAESFMKKDVWHLTPQEREFAAQNLDVTLNAVFSKEQMDAVKEKGMDIYDCIYIDGVSAAGRIGNKYDSLGSDADEAKKAEIMKCVLDGCQVDIARPDGKGSVEIIPLKASSDIPVLEAALSRQRRRFWRIPNTIWGWRSSNR